MSAKKLYFSASVLTLKNRVPSNRNENKMNETDTNFISV